MYVTTVEDLGNNGAWTVPAGVSDIKIECWGAGGGGAWNGGGGGAYACLNSLAVRPGQRLYLVNGKCAEPTESGTLGIKAGNGGITQVYLDDEAATVVCQAPGGTGAWFEPLGTGGSTKYNQVGTGGSINSCIGDTKCGGGAGGKTSFSSTYYNNCGDGGGGGAGGPGGSGKVGADGVATSGGLGGASGGGSTYAGAGGNGVGNNQSATPGVKYGGGGGGGGRGSVAAPTLGADGGVVITYTKLDLKPVGLNMGF